MNSGLLVVDVQNAFINDQTSHIPVRITKHIEKSNYDYVLFTKFVNKHNSNFVKKLHWNECFTSPAIDIHDILQKFVQKDRVFIKSTYSAFKATGLLEFLHKNSIDKLYICGIDTDACILATLYEGFDLGLDIELLVDLVSSESKTLHDYTLAILKRNIQL